MWIKIREELHQLMSKEIFGEVEHVNAHRTKKDTNDVSRFEKFVAQGNQKVNELAKAGAMLDEGFMAQARAKNGPAGKRRSVCSPAVRSQLPLFGGRMEGL